MILLFMGLTAVAGLIVSNVHIMHMMYRSLMSSMAMSLAPMALSLALSFSMPVSIKFHLVVLP